MAEKSPKYKREMFNQLINGFWTFLCFAPVVLFWIDEGINLFFYLFMAIALLFGILPTKILNLFMLSSGRKLYEKLGVKYIRKFVQNGDAVKTMTNEHKNFAINNAAQAKQYLKTIAMYERFHWICFIFFLLTGIYCFYNGHLKYGLAITVANIIYNIASIILQQYNKVRIKKIMG